MGETTTLTVRLPAATTAQLAKLAERTGRHQDLLGADAITAYVDQELTILEGIERGRADLRAGRFVTNDDAFRQLDATIEAARTKR